MEYNVNIGDKITIKTPHLYGDFEVIGKYKDSYGLDVLRIRVESDRLGGYEYFEILQNESGGQLII